MRGRLSYGVRQQSTRLFTHFLTDSQNRSTSCLFSMMLSRRQDITCHYFPHQSLSSLRSVCPLMFASVFWYLSVLLYALGCFMSLLMLQTADYNALSISHQRALFSLLVGVIFLPTVLFYPTSFDPTHCSFKLNGNVMLQSQEWWCCSIPLLHLWCAETFFVCVWSDFIVTPVKLISRGNH